MKSKTMHICFYPGVLNLGGVGRLTINLIEEMLARGNKVDLFLTNYKGSYLSILPKEVNIIKGKGGAFKSIGTFANYLRKNKPDAVISARGYLNFINIIVSKLISKDIQVIVSEHVDYSGMPEKPISIKNKILDFLLKKTYLKADNIVAVSKGVAEDFSRRYDYPLNKIEVIYNPTYKEQNYLLSRPIKNNMFFETNLPIIIGVGRLTEQKNFRLLIQAFYEVLKIKQCRLVILGEGELRSEIEKQIQGLGINEMVYMPGYVENPIDYIKKSDVFVLSSLYEGFGNVIVEALGTGISVISTDCPSGPAEILGDNEYGELVRINNVGEMKNAIIKRIESPINKTISIKRAQDFSVEIITSQYLELISESKK